MTAPTPLLDIIKAYIKADGPMSVADYMALCLSHPQHGYYMTRDPFGQQGDFTTAPEISQMFGELIGLWIGDLWTRQGKPANPKLIELGPGRGTLMRDIRRALSKVPGWSTQTPVHFVEISPALREKQQALHPDASWHMQLQDVPGERKGPSYIIANELFDALPVQQFIMCADGWRARHVDLAGDELVFMPHGPAVPLDIPVSAPGAIAEFSPASTALAAHIAHRVAASGGAALLIDYGYMQWAAGNSLQAMRGHAPIDPLATPGSADLTAHVDFAALTRAASDICQVFGPKPQGVFLNGLGLGLRARQLGGAAVSDAARLAAMEKPEDMGALFKVLSFVPKASPPPAGFAP